MTRKTPSDAENSQDPSSSCEPARQEAASSSTLRTWDDDPNEEGADHPMPILDHLHELRGRLFRCLIVLFLGFLACYSFADVLYTEILRPLETVLPPKATIIFNSLPGPFFLHLKIAALASLFLISPYVFYQFWAFITPGLYAHEKKYLVPLALFSALFFIVGASFCYYVVLPFAFSFFLSYSTDTVVAMPEVVQYFNFVLKLILAFGLIFEMPLFAFFLSRMGLITAPLMRRMRKYALLGILVIAAILTPPDVVSQLLMAAPMLVLYELSIYVAVIFGKNSKKATDEADAAKTGDEHDAQSGA